MVQEGKVEWCILRTYWVSGAQKTFSWNCQLQMQIEKLKLKGHFCAEGETEESIASTQYLVEGKHQADFTE